MVDIACGAHAGDMTNADARTVRRPLSRSGTLGLLNAGHVIDDIYQGAVPALTPFFVAARHWDYAAASGITVAATALSVFQPNFGLLTDQRPLV